MTALLEAELAEIDENLIRRELTYLEQGQHIQRREEILEAFGQRAKEGRPWPQKNNPTSNDGLKTTKDIAAEVGLKETALRDRKRVVRDITPEVQEIIQDTPLADKANDLIRLSKKAPDQQKAIAEIIVSRKVETLKQAEDILDEPQAPLQSLKRA